MFTHPEQVLNAVRACFGARSLLVVGDLMLDRYLWGRVERISPEAPVPVLRLESETAAAGGGANVARNLAALGLAVRIGGVVADDADGAALLAALGRDGVATGAVVVSGQRATTVKTRLVGNHQQMLRIDREDTHPLAPDDEERLLDGVLAALAGCDGLILSDYAKGTLTPRVCAALIAAAKRAGIAVAIDPKGRDYSKYAGATLITPNRAELALVTGVPADDLERLIDAGAALRERLSLELIVLTLGDQGIALISPAGHECIPAVAKEVYDVSGAGDTVIATFAAGRASGLDDRDTAHLANVAAGVVVGKVGTATVCAAELAAAIAPDAGEDAATKWLDWADALERVSGWRAAGERVVFTNGCFDLLHAGHVGYLEQARRLGHRLVVGLNSDRSIGEIKGPTRPIVAERDRARVLAGLASVDAVVTFDDPTPLALIEHLRPDVLVKGADYTEDAVVGAKEVRSWGGEVVLLPLLEDRSTTGIIERIVARTRADGG